MEEKLQLIESILEYLEECFNDIESGSDIEEVECNFESEYPIDEYGVDFVDLYETCLGDIEIAKEYLNDKIRG